MDIRLLLTASSSVLFVALMLFGRQRGVQNYLAASLLPAVGMLVLMWCPHGVREVVFGFCLLLFAIILRSDLWGFCMGLAVAVLIHVFLPGGLTVFFLFFMVFCLAYLSFADYGPRILRLRRMRKLTPGEPANGLLEADGLVHSNEPLNFSFVEGEVAALVINEASKPEAAEKEQQDASHGDAKAATKTEHASQSSTGSAASSETPAEQLVQIDTAEGAIMVDIHSVKLHVDSTRSFGVDTQEAKTTRAELERNGQRLPHAKAAFQLVWLRRGAEVSVVGEPTWRRDTGQTARYRQGPVVPVFGEGCELFDRSLEQLRAGHWFVMLSLVCWSAISIAVGFNIALN